MRRLACLLLVAFLGQGCALIGPAGIRAGRAAYNETIVATNNQQVLALIVGMRYGEAAGLLAVNSITSNMKVSTNAGSEFGYGPKTNYQGNLVPISIGFAYEENPTVAYAPVQGEKYLRQMLSPLPLDVTVLLINSLRLAPLVPTLLLRSVNGIRNPDFLTDSSQADDHRFAQLVAHLDEMARAGNTTWTKTVSAESEKAGHAPSFALALAGKGEGFVEQVQRLYEMLGFPPPLDMDRVITLPVRLGIGHPAEPAINLEPRSLFDILNIAAASVDVPEEHLTSGIAPTLPPVGAAGRAIHVQRSKWQPDDALTAAKAHGWWYSIARTDSASKFTFRVIESLISVRIADTVNPSAGAPVLTVPVSR